ncbi:DUF2911 domain-containing protein [Fibrivirga algicola]|uniref:DUF2911 domain-containing protein n=1 Tax=Fibrivirga algicola TaxID=2950420 RepID=A0ABX0Q9Y4_9BACT|nr:DUF2911 domain-containing protein [Fibrivirga algicola]ARK09319.1 hypothetical protein A6C57_02675 [Fibrella sp. ES10-3-2-2]NID08558.1 DUF2911 domain-containing protein [Fibrivirga algicola]
MKKMMLSAVGLVLVAQLATAQIRTPSPSPAATVMQTIGVTDVTVKYSRPSLKGRTPFTAEFVPTGSVWRTGANGATAFTTTTDLMVNGKSLAAGSYAVLSIPAASEWTLIFSKDMAVTEQSYKQDNDVLRVSMTPSKTGQKVETFTIGFNNVTDSTATMDIMWADVKASANLAANTSANAAASVDKAVADKPDDVNTLTAAASYNLSKGRNLEQSLSYVDKAIAAKETYRNLWLKAQILGKMGKFAEAMPLAQKALAMGETSGDASFSFFKDAIAKGVTEYQSKMPVAIPAKGKGKKKA